MNMHVSIEQHKNVFSRTGRWGTCVDCPRRDGEVYPEECENSGRYDHALTLDNLIEQIDRREGVIMAQFVPCTCGHPRNSHSRFIEGMFKACQYHKITGCECLKYSPVRCQDCNEQHAIVDFCKNPDANYRI